MDKPQTSIIIPVYNNWELSRQCLKSLAANTDPGRIEVIVIDNASTDATERGCPFLGKSLFGASFNYVRNKSNRNFAGASNQGAELARGEYLVFLNNDTELMPGWLDPLINDFSSYTDIAATGPLLIYPEETALGRTVQHLGIIINPLMRPGHLYQHIPASSPLVQKRRFFQAITAACLAIPRELFCKIGKFDEKYINGYEDVDLCARLGAAGWRFTVNPGSRVIHHESKSAGRHASDNRNYEYLARKSLHLLKPDWHEFLKADGLFLGISPWLAISPRLSRERLEDMEKLLEAMEIDELKDAIIGNPYWEAAWLKLLHELSGQAGFHGLASSFRYLFPDPESQLRLAHFPEIRLNKNLLGEILQYAKSFSLESDNYKLSEEGLKYAVARNIPEIGEQFRKIMHNYEDFKNSHVELLKKEIAALAQIQH